MMIIGRDFHPSFQQIAYVEQETGEYEERRLSRRGEAGAFYRSLAGRAVRIGVEATGNDRWFRKLLGELGHELLVGDASAIHASAPREQRTDKRDSRHILRLLPSPPCCPTHGSKSECALYDCDRTEHTPSHAGFEPADPVPIRITMMPDWPPARLVLAATRPLPISSHQFCFPVQFLQFRIEFAKLFGQLINLLLELCNR